MCGVEIAQRYYLDRVYTGEISGWQSLEEIERSEQHCAFARSEQIGASQPSSEQCACLSPYATMGCPVRRNVEHRGKHSGQRQERGVGPIRRVYKASPQHRTTEKSMLQNCPPQTLQHQLTRTAKLHPPSRHKINRAGFGSYFRRAASSRTRTARNSLKRGCSTNSLKSERGRSLNLKQRNVYKSPD